MNQGAVSERSQQQNLLIGGHALLDCQRSKGALQC